MRPEAFARMFQEGRYLRLMNMIVFEGTPPLEDDLAELERCIRSSPDADADVIRLFAEENWRPHVVASTAVVMGIDSPQVIAAAWARLDEHTWASPQVVAALSLADPDFLNQVDTRAATTIAVCNAKKLGAFTAAALRLDAAAGARLRDHWAARAIRDLQAAASPRLSHESVELGIGLNVTEQWLARVLTPPGVHLRLRER